MTVCVLSRRDLAELVKPPRALLVKFPYGAPLGPAHDPEIQLGVIREALALIDEATQPGILRESGYRWHPSVPKPTPPLGASTR